MNLISNYNYAISNSVDDSFNVNILKKGYKAGNVYSQFYPLINDFGIFGSIIVFSITGFVSGLIYRFRRYFIISIIYSMILTGILLSPFSEYFLTLFITPGFLFFILFIFYLKRPNFIWK
jgi:oligosaccharide repeat unit polymerase